ncbi:O-acyltransferase [Clostridia bacterium]|nr:O-acyltransferase [Clostridia bacterium]
MSIATPTFFFFAAIIIAINIISKQKYTSILLLLASLAFYAMWNIYAPIFIIAYVVLNYLFAFFIEKRPKIGLILALIINVGIFLVFARFYTLLGSTWLVKFIAPLGFSYYMFRVLGYLIDVSIGRTKPEKSLIKFMLFISFFPVLVMGPITRSTEFFAEVDARKCPNLKTFADSMILIALALLKKYVFADNIARQINPMFENSSIQNGAVWFLILLCFVIQLYLDFSAYTDIALSVSKMLGITINPNFRAPFLARNISDFWRRWHMSLSSWLSDYIFLPLQLKLRNLGVLASVIAAFVTLIVSGLWHGTLNYLIFSVFMAAFISIDALVAKRRRKLEKKAPKILFKVVTITATFVIVVLLEVFVRGRDPKQSFDILSMIFNPMSYSNPGGSKTLLMYFILSVPVVILSHYLELNAQNLNRITAKLSQIPYVVRVGLALILAYIFIFFGYFNGDIVGGFLYAKF